MVECGCFRAGGDIIGVWVVWVRARCGGVVGEWVGGIVDGEGILVKERVC